MSICIVMRTETVRVHLLKVQPLQNNGIQMNYNLSVFDDSSFCIVKPQNNSDSYPKHT